MSDINQAAAALARREANGGRAHNSMADQIRSMTSQFELAMPSGREATQLVRDALTALRQLPDLERCSTNSVLGALMTCAQLGLRPGVLGHAYVLPYGRHAQLVLGYKGLIELAYRSGLVASIDARIVYERDDFEVEYGLDPKLVHRPHLDNDSDAGRAVAYYAVARMVTGGSAFVVMSRRQAEQHKMKYGRSSGPWKTEFDAMARKTCIIALAKTLPLSDEMASAIATDERVRVDLRPDAAPEEVSQWVEADVVEDESVESSE